MKLEQIKQMYKQTLKDDKTEIVKFQCFKHGFYLQTMKQHLDHDIPCPKCRFNKE